MTPTDPGVRVRADGDAGTATLEACEDPTGLLELTTGDDVVVVCGSYGLTVLAGPVTLVLPNGTEVVAPTGAVVEVTPDGSTGWVVENRPNSEAGISITIDGSTTILEPGDSITANRAPSAADDHLFMDKNAWLLLPAPGVLDNDVDPEGDGLRARLTAQPDDGVAALGGAGWLFYAPPRGFTGTVEIGYEACDPGGTCDDATVIVHVRRRGGRGR